MPLDPEPAVPVTISYYSFTSIYEFLLYARTTKSGTGESLKGIDAGHCSHESTGQDTWINIQR